MLLRSFKWSLGGAYQCISGWQHSKYLKCHFTYIFLQFVFALGSDSTDCWSAHRSPAARESFKCVHDWCKAGWHRSGGIDRVASTGWHRPGGIDRVASAGWHRPGGIDWVASAGWHRPGGIDRVASTGWHRPGGIDRVASTGWHRLCGIGRVPPSKQKSWLRRCLYSTQDEHIRSCTPMTLTVNDDGWIMLHTHMHVYIVATVLAGVNVSWI